MHSEYCVAHIFTQNVPMSLRYINSISIAKNNVYTVNQFTMNA
jgi:hypothetical protein